MANVVQEKVERLLFLLFTESYLQNASDVQIVFALLLVKKDRPILFGCGLIVRSIIDTSNKSSVVKASRRKSIEAARPLFCLVLSSFHLFDSSPPLLSGRLLHLNINFLVMQCPRPFDASAHQIHISDNNVK